MTAGTERKSYPFKGINVTLQYKGRSNTTAEDNIEAYLQNCAACLQVKNKSWSASQFFKAQISS